MGGPEGASRLQHVERALDVGVDVRVGRVIGERNSDECGEVKNDVAALCGFAHAVGIPNVAREHVQGLLSLARQRVEPAPAVEGVVVDESADIASAIEERLDQVASDEAIGAGHQHFPTFELHGCRSTAGSRQF
jgi:hypothetical protein